MITEADGCMGKVPATLLHKRQLRRAIAAILAIAGGALIWLAPETVIGIVMLGLGIGLEIIGIGMEHWARR